MGRLVNNKSLSSKGAQEMQHVTNAVEHKDSPRLIQLQT